MVTILINIANNLTAGLDFVVSRFLSHDGAVLTSDTETE